MHRILPITAMLWACSPEDLEAPEAADPSGARVIDEGTPEATGVLAFLNDRGTTTTLLDIQVALDARAARGLTAHRNGPDGRLGTADDDRFDTIAEVDAVPRVGDVALQRILDYADAHGWIPSTDPIYGTVEGVELTVPQAVDILRAANGATFTELDVDAALDARAAQGILDHRPFGLVEDVAAAPYVGATALRRLFGWAAAEPVIALDAEWSIPVLETASAGLWFTSESDYPLEIWSLPAPAAPLTTANAASALAGAYSFRVGTLPLDQRTAEEVDLAWFFDRYTVEQDWWDPQQRADAEAWRGLRDVFERQVLSPQVFRFGRQVGNILSGDIDVFVIGRTRDGAIVGVRTVSIET